MKICYTVCSLNRLGQVVTLADSLLKFNPDYKFICGLADEIDGRIEAESFPQIEFIEFSTLLIKGKEGLSSRYNIFELSCVLKPYFALHIIEKYQPELLVYLDTDICIYNNFQFVEKRLNTCSIVISPHFISPPPADNKFPRERDVLNSGLYNGGFYAVKNDDAALSFLKWWKERLFYQGFNNVCEGMMVDQLWLNLVPVYFKEAEIVQHPGYNLAYWNMHERNLELLANEYKVNREPLVFFHFSGYRIEQPSRLSLHQNRIIENEYPALSHLINDYYGILIQNKFNEYKSFTPYYGRKNQNKQSSVLKKAIISVFARFGYALEKVRKID